MGGSACKQLQNTNIEIQTPSNYSNARLGPIDFSKQLTCKWDSISSSRQEPKTNLTSLPDEIQSSRRELHYEQQQESIHFQVEEAQTPCLPQVGSSAQVPKNFTDEKYQGTSLTIGHSAKCGHSSSIDLLNQIPEQVSQTSRKLKPSKYDTMDVVPENFEDFQTFNFDIPINLLPEKVTKQLSRCNKKAYKKSN